MEEEDRRSRRKSYVEVTFRPEALGAEAGSRNFPAGKYVWQGYAQVTPHSKGTPWINQKPGLIAGLWFCDDRRSEASVGIDLTNQVTDRVTLSELEVGKPQLHSRQMCTVVQEFDHLPRQPRLVGDV